MIDAHSDALVASPRAPSAGWVLAASVPPLVREAGPRAVFHSVEFFTARIPNANTRATYGRAVSVFCDWCEQRALPLPALSSPILAAYFEDLKQRFSAATVNLHLSAIRQWLDWLTQRGTLPFNPAASVKGPRLSREEGKTPVLSREQARRLFASLDTAADVVSLRDRAVLAVMLYGFVRVGAVVRMRVSDFQEDEGEAWLVLHEKGGKDRRLPAHHLVRLYLRSYLEMSGLGRLEHRRIPLFQSAPRFARTLSGRPLDRSSVLGIVKRRCRAVGLPAAICNHSFRATGITIHQENGGDIQAAARLAGHSDPRTTQLYSRSRRPIASLEVERIQL
jgi:integrase/recombinase XerD